jgi:two-component system, sensor histidine kinase
MILDGKSILIIDDSDTIRTYLRNVLEQKGASLVQSAATAREGLALCAEHTYDLILLDLFLPDTDGIEVLKEIRTTNDISTIVMITGYGGIKSAIAAVQMGADGYIEKQDITSTQRDHIDFLYALDQAMEHRAGLAAKKQLEQIRAELYAMVTHDLRNPTSLILMTTDVLLNDELDSLQQQQLIMGIDNAAQRLIRLINDYLDFAKIDAGYLRLEFGSVDLIQVVEASASFARLQTQAKQQTLTITVPPAPVTAWADAERLRQVLDNLLSNATKYTPHNEHIVLQLHTEDGHAVFRVSDTGRGIPPEYLPNLCTKYFRVPGEATRRTTGTGLGLLIVKEIVEAHGGRVEVQSEGVAGKGTTFVITIPLQPPGDGSKRQALVQVVPQPEPGAEHAGADPATDLKLREVFWRETQAHLSVLRQTLESPLLLAGNRELLDQARHTSHTLKGNAGAMQFDELYALAAELDSKLQEAARGSVLLVRTDLNDLRRLLDRIDSMAAEGKTV